jgi:hypothetical protein
MLTYLGVKDNDKQLQSLVGMSKKDFELLHNDYQVTWTKYIDHYKVNGTVRIRPHRIRKDGDLERTEDQLLFILHYLKSNSIQEHHAAAYGMRQSHANAWIHLLLKLLHQTLRGLGQLPQRNASKLKKLLANIKEVYIDGTERDIQRPSDNETQKAHYSGKKNS